MSTSKFQKVKKIYEKLKRDEESVLFGEDILTNIKFNFGSDFDDNINIYLGGIDAENDDKYNLLTNETSKYLLCRCSDFLMLKNIKVPRQT